MSKYFNLNNLPTGKNWAQEPIFGKARGNQPINKMQYTFDENVLDYLSEKVLNHIADSMTTEELFKNDLIKNRFNDYSFLTAPAYKALEGFLFQIAEELDLSSSGNKNLAGSYYFDEKKIDKHIDKLLKELEAVMDKEKKLSRYEKRDIKDRIKEMKGFLQHYRNTPAHFYGELIDTVEKANININIIYGAISNTTKILLKAKLIEISDDLH